MDNINKSTTVEADAAHLEVSKNKNAAKIDINKTVNPRPFDAVNDIKNDVRDGTNSTRPLTELGNAQRLNDLHKEKVRYVSNAYTWIMWDESWQWCDESEIRRLAAALQDVIYREGAAFPKDGEVFAKHARKSQDRKTICNTIALWSDFKSIRITINDIDSNPFMVGLDQARLVIDLKTGKTRPAVQSDYITKSLMPDALGNSEEAERWIEFLNQIFDNDQELIDWMQMFLGYLLTGSTREQIFLFLYGLGANGKSVFVELVKYILGDYGRAISSETLSEGKRQAGSASPELANLIGSRLAVCSETEDGTALAESLVKSLVSGDTLSARKLYQGPIEYQPQFKLMMMGNHKPVIRGNDHGMWRRVRLVPFNRTFSEQERDPHLIDKLKSESNHILAWMIEGCIKWQKTSLANVPESIKCATDEYQSDQDIIGLWLSECTEADNISETPSSALYESYKNWCMDNGHRAASKTALGRRLKDRRFTNRKSHGRMVWVGINLLETPVNEYERQSNGY